MAGSVRRRWGACGGIIELASVIAKHGDALEYDLMTMTGRTLAEYEQLGGGGRMALVAFLRYVPVESAIYRALNPRSEVSAWGMRLQSNLMLADIVDVINGAAYTVASAVAGSKRVRKPKSYPRPGAEKKTIGSGAIPLREFDDWWEA